MHPVPWSPTAVLSTGIYVPRASVPIPTVISTHSICTTTPGQYHSGRGRGRAGGQGQAHGTGPGYRGTGTGHGAGDWGREHWARGPWPGARDWARGLGREQGAGSREQGTGTGHGAGTLTRGRDLDPGTGLGTGTQGQGPWPGDWGPRQMHGAGTGAESDGIIFGHGRWAGSVRLRGSWPTGPQTR